MQPTSIIVGFVLVLSSACAAKTSSKQAATPAVNVPENVCAQIQIEKKRGVLFVLPPLTATMGAPVTVTTGEGPERLKLEAVFQNTPESSQTYQTELSYTIGDESTSSPIVIAKLNQPTTVEFSSGDSQHRVTMLIAPSGDGDQGCSNSEEPFSGRDHGTPN